MREGRSSFGRLLFNQIRRHGRVVRSRLSSQSQQPVKFFRLLLIQFRELHAKPFGAVMPDFAFKVKPIAIGQQDAETDNLSAPHFANRIKVTTAF